MPTIPTLTNQVRTEAAPNFQQRPLESTAVQSIGAGLSDVSDVLFRVRQQEQLKADRAAFMDADRQTDTAANDLIAHAQTLQGKDAIGSTPKLLSEFDKVATTTEQGLKTSRAKLTYRESVNARRSALQRQLDGHEGSQREAYYAKSREDFKDQAHINAVTNYRDPKAIDIELEKVRGAIAQTPGMDDAQRATEFDIRRSSIYAGVIDRFLANDQVGKARAYYETVKGNAGARAAYIENRISDAARALEARTKAALVDQTAQRVLNAYQASTHAGTQALQAVTSSTALPAELIADVRVRVHQGLGLLHAERREQYADDVNNLERSIANGTPATDAESQVKTLYGRAVYTPEQYTNVLQSIDESRQKGAKKAATVVAVQNAIATGQRLDPKDTDVVKAVDTWFQSATDVNHIPPGSNEWINSAAAIANKTNILPPEAMSWARKTILSGEPNLAVPAANAIRRWADAAPAAYAYFDDPQLKAQAEAIDSMVRVGVPPANAVEIARANTFDIPKARKDELQADYTKQKYAASNTSFLQNSMNADDNFDREVIPNAPAAPLAMQDEYNALVRTYFDHTNGDIKRSRDLAWHDIRGTYGVSTVNGAPQILKHAPERTFPGIDPAVIRADIDEAAKAAGIPGKAILTPSSDTDDTGGIVWKLTTVDADGYVDVLLDDKNRPIKYAIPTDTAAYLKAQEDTKRQAVDAARVESARRREAAGAFPEEAFGGY